MPADVLFRAFDCSIYDEQGAGVGDSGGFLPSVGAVFDVCQRVERASARDTLFFAVSLFSFRRLSGGSVATARRTFCFAPLIVQFVMAGGGGWGFRWLFTVGGGGFRCMSARRESERTGYIVFFAVLLFSFRRLGGGGGVSVLSAAALLVCMPADHEGEHARPLVSFGYSDFLREGADTGDFGGSLPSAATLLVRIPVDRVASVQYLYIYICAPIVQCSRTG